MSALLPGLDAGHGALLADALQLLTASGMTIVSSSLPGCASLRHHIPTDLPQPAIQHPLLNPKLSISANG
jgi:hypothetical protein